ncbi:MAG: hypothetical protein DMG81_05225 [Acidobacteria bacterium]|nr:MAG: hypothetical protein DMG81_05225 [Acidobacteriota bacterium]
MRTAFLLPAFLLPAFLLPAFLQRRPVRGDDVGEILVLFFQIHEIGNVQEGVAFQANVDEGGLHPGKHAGDAPFVDRAG